MRMNGMKKFISAKQAKLLKLSDQVFKINQNVAKQFGMAIHKEYVKLSDPLVLDKKERTIDEINRIADRLNFNKIKHQKVEILKQRNDLYFHNKKILKLDKKKFEREKLLS